MSIQALSWALKFDGLRTAEKFVLIVLANYADDENQCYPSQKLIAKMTSMTDRGVRNCLKSLEEKDIISRYKRQREDGSRSTDMYLLNLDIPPNRNDDPEVRNRKTSKRNKTAKIEELSSEQEPINNLNKKNKQKKEKQIIFKKLKEVLDDERAKALIDHRKQIKKPLTERAATLMVNELKKTNNPNEASDKIVLNGWTGFNADWIKNQSASQARQSEQSSNAQLWETPDQRMTYFLRIKIWPERWGKHPEQWGQDMMSQVSEENRKAFQNLNKTIRRQAS